MSDLTRTDGRELEQFDPQRYRLNQRAVDFGIEEAKRIQDWPVLEQAVDAKIGEQHKFVAWWKANVKDGRPSKVAENAATFLTQSKAESLTGMKHQRVFDLAARLDNPEKYREHLLGAEYCAAFLSAVKVRGSTGTGENEWFTPREYIELARAVLGSIDLDPASSKAAQAIVKAERYFDKKIDGLTQQWFGRVWMNPPYAQPLIAQFVSKLVNEWNAGHLSAAISLTHNYTDTAWFHELAGAASAMCFTRGRVKFYEGDHVAAPTQGQAFVYFGDNVASFVDHFKSIGFVMVPASVGVACDAEFKRMAARPNR